MFEPIKNRLRAALEWLGDEAHRRAFTGILTSGIALYAGHEIDSAVVDAALLVVVPALLSMWSSRTPKLRDPS
jgi:hypothetical protein